MKFRLTVLLVLLSLALSACSLAEDITPPPGYTSPNSLPTIVPANQTLVNSPTTTSIPASESAAPTAGITASVTDSTTPSVETNVAAIESATSSTEISPTPQAELLAIDGTLTVASGTAIPDETNANLLLIVTTTGQIAQTLTVPILPDGKYKFTNVPADTTTYYLVTVDYKGVTYESSPVQFDGTTTQFNLPVTAYDSTEDLNILTITKAHLQFDFSTTGQVQVGLVYVIINSGTSSVIFPSNGSDVPFIQIPASSANVQYQMDQSSSPLMVAAKGYAFLPGADKQYVVITTFTLPYTNSLVYSQSFSPPVTSATVIVPEGVKVVSDQLTDGGTQASTDSTVATFHLYQAGSLASGSTLTMKISGKPGEKSGSVLDQRNLLLIGVVVLGLLMVGLGIFLFLRDRRLRKLEEEFEGDQENGNGNEDALGENRESIMDAIIALDDQFKAGDISKEAYEKRRDELKGRLKNLA